MTAVDIALHAVAAVLLVCIVVGLWRAVCAGRAPRTG
ncbi:flagellar biosynthesis protein FliQ [Microbacterium paludicola]|uniref:Flagellar biosynthesis protein FliQ n=1 Tax=Microbacterium paludicola TaxID=300019 RepID=A0ABU1I0R7_9MICO|nr:flagellar biosynthesis protein FliQ [Microbacterium paludicola]